MSTDYVEGDSEPLSVTFWVCVTLAAIIFGIELLYYYSLTSAGGPITDSFLRS